MAAFDYRRASMRGRHGFRLLSIYSDADTLRWRHIYRQFQRLRRPPDARVIDLGGMRNNMTRGAHIDDSAVRQQCMIRLILAQNAQIS